MVLRQRIRPLIAATTARRHPVIRLPLWFHVRTVERQSVIKYSCRVARFNDNELGMLERWKRLFV